jgi:hypothetical protein
MADTGQNWLPREEAKAIVDELLSRSRYEESLFRHLVSEGVIAEDRFLSVDSEWCEGIHFSFERLGDHLIAKHLLDKHLNLNDPSQSFTPANPLGALVKDEYACWRNHGVIEALSIQLPERTGKELLEIAEFCAEFYPICRAFIESLIWRNPEAITEETCNCINKYVLRSKDTFDQFLDALLTVSSDPEHPYNADFLHEWMMKCSLAERDSWWSIFIFEQYRKCRAVDRLIDWALSPEDKSHIDDESVRLSGTALAWFLTTSHRYLRDGATKALVNLLTERIHVLEQIIHKFLDVNDPYVLERLLAVAYGCVMRSMDNNAIGELAQNIYEWIFKNGEPPPHLLLRDYARGVIELALCRGIALNIDMEKVRPPYKSEWPSEIPTKEELEKYEKWEEDMSDEEWAKVSISYSVKDLNIHNFQWSSHRLGEPREQTREEIYEDFVHSLSDKQREAWERYRSVQGKLDIESFRQYMDTSIVPENSESELSKRSSEDTLKSAEESFIKTLGKKKFKIYKEIVVPYLNDPNLDRDKYRFDLSIAHRWILKRIFDLGWTTEYFGSFDASVLRSYDRREQCRLESIGEKYQWIAYHEFLARLSDNFEFRNGLGFRTEDYDGPWQLDYIRDIDPSNLLRKTKREVWGPHTNTWWFSPSYDSWDSECDDVKWLKNSKDIPPIEQLVEVARPDGKEWLSFLGIT